ncbi:MAG TPA: DUF4270 domain-containing protein [Flavobacteriaceae bacterium]|nr:DUF4270 domain-containing protein [Flavobacteriaceae bacterium]HEX5743061.1 DUF4270 domain-containing protein [Flavobacteriaceae bacterium]
MTINKYLKYLPLFLIIIGSIFSCEKDLEDIGGNLINNNLLNTNKQTVEVVAFNKNVEKTRANTLGQYLLGVYNDADFGKINASVASTLSLPVDLSNGFGKNPHIEMVILDIPYHATKNGNKTVNVSGVDKRVPNFKLDSIIGNKDIEFQLGVFELGTFLNTLDPLNPSQNMVYYTDKDYQKITPSLYTGNFKPNENDTVLYVDRLKPILAGGFEVYTRDTIKKTDKKPSIKLPLNTQKFKQLFVDKAPGTEFASQENFSKYFRGLFIEATPLANPSSSLLSLNISDATVTIYYSNDVETTTNNVVTTTRTKQKLVFPLGGIIANKITRDYSGSNAQPFLTNPNTTSGDSKLYVQGSAGSMAIMKFDENIKNLRNNKWLINEASLLMYIDKNASSKNYPERLFLYDYDSSTQLKDLFTEGPTVFSGFLERDKDSVPYRYKFRITDYVSDVLKKENTDELFKFGIKVFSPSDLPQSATDTKFRDYSWTPKGVVLHGNQTSDVDKRIRLEIHYTEINN